MLAKTLRSSRLFPATLRRAVMLAMDHGLSAGPLRGLESPVSVLVGLPSGPLSAVILNRGQLRAALRDERCHQHRFIMHLSASTNLCPDPRFKVLAADVEEALILGADGVSVQICMGHPREQEMLADLGRVARQADQYGLPLLVMMYLYANVDDAESLAIGARACAELGADMVKLKVPRQIEGLQRIVAGAGIPVLVAGGDRLQDDDAFLDWFAAIMDQPVAGAVIGRNLFQSQNPSALVTAMERIIDNRAVAGRCARLREHVA